MCGIAGFVSKDTPVPDGEAVLLRFQRALHHRGPDDHGSLLTPDGRAGLTATRLAILDLSAAGHQPMQSADGRHAIVFNGEIYNFRELRAGLAENGVRFRSDGDTEVVLELFRAEGTACVKRLRGMFAFAIWSRDTKTCFLARDPLGIKPLYYHADGPEGRLAFASELTPLIRSGLVQEKIDASALRGYFRSGSVPEPATLIEGVRMLEAGTWMSWGRGEIVETKKYWKLKFGSEEGDQRSEIRGQKSDTEAAESVRAALSDSIEKHFVSDVPVGLFLSGGIDSTALLAMANAAGRKDLRTFSVGSEDPEFNESDVAARTARHFATDHAVLELDGATARVFFDQFLNHMDQPSVDGFNTFTVSHLAHSHAMKVVLSGLGGDELFGGYASFAQVPRMVEFGSNASFLGPLRFLAGRLLSRSRTTPRWRRLGAFLSQPPGTEAAYQAFRGIFTPAEADALAAVVCGRSETGAEAAESTMGHPTIADEISALEISKYMRNQLLRDSDVMSMANELELRVPFVDSEFVDSITRIPARLRLQRGKRLLLDAVPEIPSWVAGAPKRGFRFPFEQWLTTEWTRGSNLAFNANVRTRTWYQRWTIFVFEAWLRRVSGSSTFHAK